jgi:dinuclear metal center YbgI/SA1388 family protein
LRDALDERFPPAWAEPWDRVGLITGDQDVTVSGVVVTLDATAEAVDRALVSGANVLVTHHPPFLQVPSFVAPSAGPAGTLEAALRAGVAVLSYHTSLDRAPDGASALALELGLTPSGPLESGVEPIAHVVTYVPRRSADDVRHAMEQAGAGRLGQYEGCAFAADGRGWFRPLGGSAPAVAPSEEGVAEMRLEMVAAPGDVAAVLDAARQAHPYEEPLIIATEGVRSRGAARLGRVCALAEGETVASIAARVARALHVRPRIWGEPARPVHVVALANGSAGSLIPDAMRHKADVLVAGEVRYHDALEARASGMCIIEAGHDATEWPLVDVLARACRSAVPSSVAVTAEAPTPRWWTWEGSDERR